METELVPKPNGAPPKRERKHKEEIVPLPQVRLGSVTVNNPREIVAKATEYADVLAEIIIKQDLFKMISGRKYVVCEGWTTLGAMLGVLPIEEYCRPLPEGGGFEAKVNLIRTSDGQVIGGASAECTREEPTWSKRSSYALRSMSITRATGKAFRLSFSWIMKLAGFEATPAEEMHQDTGSREAAQEVAKEKIAAHEAKKPKVTPPTCLFYVLPEAHNGHQAELVNVKEFGSSLNEVAAEGLKQLLLKYVHKGKVNGELLVSSDRLQALADELQECGVPLSQLKAAKG